MAMLVDGGRGATTSTVKKTTTSRNNPSNVAGGSTYDSQVPSATYQQPRSSQPVGANEYVPYSVVAGGSSPAPQYVPPSVPAAPQAPAPTTSYTPPAATGGGAGGGGPAPSAPAAPAEPAKPAGPDWGAIAKYYVNPFTKDLQMS